MKKIPVQVKRLHEDAKIPFYATEGSAGFDFYTIEDIEISPNETKIIKTGLAMAIPLGYEIQMRPRSGIAFKTTLIMPNSPGTIDSDYRGEFGIIIRNIGSETYRASKGERIAQGVLNEVPVAQFFEVSELDETDRGVGGYGSTGLK